MASRHPSRNSARVTKANIYISAGLLTWDRMIRDRASDGEARPAPAGGCGVRVVDPERRAQEVVDVVDFRAVDQAQGDGVDQHAGAALVDHQVVGGPIGHQVEPVLEARAAATLDTDAEHGRGWLAGDDLGDATCGAVADGYGGLAHMSFTMALMSAVVM